MLAQCARQRTNLSRHMPHTHTHTEKHTHTQVCALIFWFYFGPIQLATVMDGDRQAGGSDAAWRWARYGSVR